MIYLSVPPVAKEHTRMVMAAELGVIVTPNVGRKADWCGVYPIWAADNGCFSQVSTFQLERYLGWLKKRQPYASTCLFAPAPDVVGDAKETWKRSRDVLPEIRSLGFKAALVAQNGIDSPEWDRFDALFVGGDDDFKTAPSTDDLVREAKYRGKWTHLGRVNTEARALRAKSVGYDSADGTLLRFGPDANIGRVKRWIQLFKQMELPGQLHPQREGVR